MLIMIKGNIKFIKLYIFSYMFFIFVQFVCKDSTLGGSGGIQMSPSFYTRSAAKLYYFSVIFCAIINCIIYIFYNRYNHSILSISIFIFFLIIFIILELLKVSFITPFLFIIFLFIINLNIIDFRVFIKCDFVVRSVSILFVILLYYINILPKYNDNLLSHSGQSIRYALGFSHPNELGIAFLSLFISGYLFIRELNKIWYIIFSIIFLLIFIIISRLSDSREFEICGALIIISILLNRINLWNRLCKFLAIPSIIISLAFYLYVMFFYNNNSKFINILNNISSGRISYQVQALNIYPAKLSGYKNMPLLSPIYNNGHNIPVDDLYTSLLFKCGIIGLIIYEIVFFSLPIILFRTRKNPVYILIIICAICSFAGYSSDLTIIFLIIYSLYFDDVIKRY